VGGIPNSEFRIPISAVAHLTDIRMSRTF